MTRTLFPQIIDKYFDAVIGRLTDYYNDQRTPSPYLFRSMLTEEYSADLMWSSADFRNNIIAADVVTMDSSLPLKKRDTLHTAVGAIPKIGISYTRSEKFLSDIQVMMARNAREQEIAARVLSDVNRVVTGIDVRTEIMFLQGLSTGVVLVNDPDDPSVGIRASYGYADKNFFHATGAAWGSQGARPLDDIQQLFDEAQADGGSIGHVMISKKYMNHLRNSEQGRRLASIYAGQVVLSQDQLLTPSRQAMMQALEDEFGATFEVVDSSFRVEHNDGTLVNVRPWEEANVVAMPSRLVGRLVYGSLAEESNPVNQVTYAKVGTHILVSEFGETNPLREYTTGQAICLPVIDNAQSIYVLEANKVASESTGAPGLEPTVPPGRSTASSRRTQNPKPVQVNTAGGSSLED